MILVGFAETVVDAPSLQHCFDNCLNSRQLYGFRCASGMYYFEVAAALAAHIRVCNRVLQEPQLNCILNTEDRGTQPDLFTSENSDLVDYFEASCNSTAAAAANRRFAPTTHASRNSAPLTHAAANTLAAVAAKKKDFVERAPSLSSSASAARRLAGGRWTEWSSCSGGDQVGGGRGGGVGVGAARYQWRQKICTDGEICGRDVRVCDSTRHDPSISKSFCCEHWLSTLLHTDFRPSRRCAETRALRSGCLLSNFRRLSCWHTTKCARKAAAMVQCAV